MSVLKHSRCVPNKVGIAPFGSWLIFDLVRSRMTPELSLKKFTPKSVQKPDPPLLLRDRGCCES